MEKTHLERKVGLFIFIAMVLLGTMLVLFSKGTSLFHGTYALNLHTSNVGGLKQQSAVLLAGVGVGNVHEISIDPSGTNVTIVLQIYKKYPIYHDARFVIEEAGFLGDHYISVIPTLNTLPILTNDSDVECESPFNLQEVARGAAGFVQRLDETAKKLDASVTDLRARVLNDQTLANFGTSITNLRDTTEQALGTIHDIHNLIDTNSAPISLAVSNFVLFSAQLNQLGDSASHLLATNGANLTAATRNIDDLTVGARQILDDVHNGKGLAGTLLQNGQTATNVQILADNLSQVSSNLNRFGLWHILWSHSPPATNSVKPVTLENPPIRQ
jgi:phospholipid/cholesterol/gamma-HCH transport system substrate-binding protein